MDTQDHIDLPPHSSPSQNIIDEGPVQEVSTSVIQGVQNVLKESLEGSVKLDVTHLDQQMVIALRMAIDPEAKSIREISVTQKVPFSLQEFQECCFHRLLLRLSQHLCPGFASAALRLQILVYATRDYRTQPSQPQV